MNKLIPIIAILIVVAVAAGYLILKPSPGGEYETEDITYSLESPNGYDLTVRSVRPKLTEYPNEKFPAILRLPGGWAAGAHLLDAPLTRDAASSGIILVAFDSEPKLEEDLVSEARNYNGFKDQDDVAVVLESIFNEPNVDASRVGVWSSSYGVTAAAGVLGREEYTQLSEKVRFLLDYEGPHCVKDILENPSRQGQRDTWNPIIEAKVGEGKEYRSVRDFFSERCAVNFIGNFKGIYQRMQGKNDHALKYYQGHAVAMLNAATNGDAEWTRLNLEPKNQIYTEQSIGRAIDIEKFAGKNDERVWNMLFKLLGEIK